MITPERMSASITQARRGDRAAQHLLYQAFAPMVFGVCLRYARDRSQADDFAQEAWVQAFTKLTQFAGDGEFGAWLRKLAVNTCLMELRRRRDSDWMEAEALFNGKQELPAKLQLEPTALTALSASELLAHIQGLPEGFRLVFNLVAIEGYSHAEAALALGIAESSSRSQLTRARTLLQRKLASIVSLCI